jgi:hypothetical protein
MKSFKRLNSGLAAATPTGVVPAPGGRVPNSLQQRIVHSGQEAGRGRLRRHGTVAGVVAALSAGALALSAGSASAAAALVSVTTNNPVGVYNEAKRSSGKIGIPDMGLGDAIVVTCWDRGEDINRKGNVWYKAFSERYTATGQELFVIGWTYGAYVDVNAAFHNGSVPHC